MGKGKRLRAAKKEAELNAEARSLEKGAPRVPDIVRCDKCGAGFSVSAVGIATRKVKNEDLHVDCFICSECNTVYVIFIKDEETMQLQADLRELEKRIKKLRGSKKFELSKRVNDTYLKKQQRLKMHQDALKRRFNGTFTTVTSEENTVDIVYLPRR